MPLRDFPSIAVVGKDAFIQQVARLRTNDQATVETLEKGKLKGRLRTGFRAVPSLSTDIVAGDAEGDIVVDGADIYWLLNNGTAIEWVTVGAGGGGGGGNSFTTIAVSGQSDVVADSSTDTLTLVAGSGITITTNAGTDSITIASAQPRTGQATVDFGAVEDGVAEVAVSAAWVTAGSIIVASPSGVATADHDADDYAVEGITASVKGISAGVGFTIAASAPNGSFGQYTINYVGMA